MSGRARDLLLVAAVHDDDRIPVLAEMAAALASGGDDRDRIGEAAGEAIGDVISEMIGDAIRPAEDRRILIRLTGSPTASGPAAAAPERIVFAEPLLRSVVLDSEPLVRIQTAHAAVAACLGPDDDRTLWHHAHAVVGPDEPVAAALESAAAEAAAGMDFAAAAVLAERAAELTADHNVRASRLLAAAAHCEELGRRDVVGRLLAEAARGPLGLVDRARAELLTLDLGDGADDPAVIGHLRALALATASVGEDALGWELLAAAALRAWRADPGPAERGRIVETADQLSVPTGDRSRPDPRRLFVMAMADPVGHGAEVLSALAAISAEDLAAAEPRAVAAWGMAARAVGDHARAAELLGRAGDGLRAQGRHGRLALVSAMQAGALVADGEFVRARAVAEETLRLSESTGQPMWQAGALTVLGLVDAVRGDFAGATRIADELAQDPVAFGPSLVRSLICQIRGVALMAAGRHAEAYPILRQAFDTESAAYHVSGRISALGHLAETAVHCGAVPDARAVVAAMAEVHRSAPAPSLRAQIAVAEAFLAEEAQGAQVCEAALAVTGLPVFARARIELVHGRWSRRNRLVAASREPLASAAAAFDRLGARYWAERALAELGAAGERGADGRPVSGPGTGAVRNAALESLSPQERQVALLAAQGLTNPQIGRRLSIAHRTVSSHLARIFPKLGITSRGQLAGRIGGDGMDGAADPAEVEP
ncbi:LuxR C-terminal-related transcriptional regulator [Catenulispora yoronensis]